MSFEELSTSVNSIYYGCCDRFELAASPADYDSYINDLIEKIFELKQAPILDEVLFETYAKKLTEATLQGYGIKLKDVDWSSSESRTIRSLLDNVWHFSAAKSYAQLRDIGAKLIKPDGSYRDFKDFKIEADRVAGTHLTWLKAEYNNAIGGAQMVALWKKVQAQKEIFPFLEFDAVMDKGTTALCSSLDGVIRPVDDPFWQTYFPLNHWGCRSTVRLCRTAEITPDHKITYPEIPAMFKTNLGEKGLVFPQDHPYFTGLPDGLSNAVRAYMPYPSQFDIADESDALEGIVRLHYKVDKEQSDFDRLFAIALDKAKKKGTVVDIMPTLNPNNSAQQREIIFPDAKLGKSPDLRLNGKLVEEELSTVSTNLNNIKHAIDAGSKQADHVIVSLSSTVSKATMRRIAKGRFIDHKELMVIEFVQNGVYTVIKRPLKS